MSRRCGSRFHVLLGCFLVLAGTGAQAASTLPTPTVALGEVRSLTPRQAADLSMFRAMVRSTFAGLKFRSDVERSSYILSATLLEFRTIKREHSHTTTCIVTATLRDRSQGSLKATLKGEARLSESESPSKEGDRLVMQAAVRRALFGVNEVLK